MTRDEAIKLFEYDPETGIVKRQFPTQRGTIFPVGSGHGYLQFPVKERGFWVKVYAHQIAWLIVTGKWEQLDHKNRNGNDNRLDNLRPSDKSSNAHNQGENIRNKSGQKGVYFHAGKWKAEIVFEGTYNYLGRFLTFEEAKSAYIEASKRLCGEFSIYA